MKKSLEKLFAAFSGVEPITEMRYCDCQVCPSKDIIRNLIEKPLSDLNCDDLFPYIESVFVTVGSSNDFIYLLPALLKIWSQEIYKGDSAFREKLHMALARERFIYKNLPVDFSSVVTDFMRDELLERIEHENTLVLVGNSLSHQWFYIMSSYGTYTKDIPNLWKRWLEFATEGHAIAFIQYASVLICDKEDNPVFAPWTREEGGGAPALWEYDSCASGESWMKENIDYIEGLLTVEYLEKTLSLAKDKMNNQPKANIVDKIQSILRKNRGKAKFRINELKHNLSKKSV